MTAAMRSAAAFITNADRDSQADASIVQTHLPTNTKTVKRDNIKTCLRANSTTVKRANHKTRIGENGKTRLREAGSAEQTGLPANVQTLQQKTTQPLKQGWLSL
jgi:hypothetical protein